jgi:hypothetical protein
MSRRGPGPAANEDPRPLINRAALGIYPPGVASSGSAVLDAFVAAVAATDPARAEPLQRELEVAAASGTEHDFLNASVTAAVTAASKAVGEEPRTTLMTTGDDAFVELTRFRPFIQDDNTSEILRQLAQLLELAADERGPFRGGELGSLNAPGDRPRVVEGFEPTTSMMVEIARAAGVVVGLIGAAGKTDSVAEVRAVIKRELGQTLAR